MRIFVTNIRDMLADDQEELVREYIGMYSCEMEKDGVRTVLNPDIERFLNHNSIQFGGFIRRQESRGLNLSQEKCCHMFGVSRSGYNAWKERRKRLDEARDAKELEEEELKDKLRTHTRTARRMTTRRRHRKTW